MRILLVYTGVKQALASLLHFHSQLSWERLESGFGYSLPDENIICCWMFLYSFAWLF